MCRLFTGYMLCSNIIVNFVCEQSKLVDLRVLLPHVLAKHRSLQCRQ